MSTQHSINIAMNHWKINPIIDVKFSNQITIRYLGNSPLASCQGRTKDLNIPSNIVFYSICDLSAS